MLRILRRRPRPARVIYIHWLPAPPELPPVARHFLPEATGEEAESFNRSRLATAVALRLFRDGHREDVADAVINQAATGLGRKQPSGRTRAAVRAALAVLRTDPHVIRGR
ncbi:hypothetical protein [Streptomyces xinghaiensis]|uniref:hypothetical protein n=1 Tax=Streptomyces xinghaiensis TaxID=1038928 RepID=UPI00059533B2|nr:hypothetical protein [Streptomyces xinghaiensis]MZE80926.1 hypothetical protein [Streptomyces sp. SID5475]